MYHRGVSVSSDNPRNLQNGAREGGEGHPRAGTRERPDPLGQPDSLGQSVGDVADQLLCLEATP